METARNDVAKLMGATADEPVKIINLYRVRKSWEDEKSQIGAYQSLENAKSACDKAGEGYEVYNEEGVAIYPEAVKVDEEKEVVEEVKVETGFKRGQTVQLTGEATHWVNGKAILGYMYSTKFYVRAIKNNGEISLSNTMYGSIIGTIDYKYITNYTGKFAKPPQVNKPIVEEKKDEFEPYIVRVTADVLNVRSGPGTGYKITRQVKKHGLYTIVAENGKWGKLKSGAGWISLDYVQKI